MASEALRAVVEAMRAQQGIAAPDLTLEQRREGMAAKPKQR